MLCVVDELLHRYVFPDGLAVNVVCDPGHIELFPLILTEIPEIDVTEKLGLIVEHPFELVITTVYVPAEFAE